MVETGVILPVGEPKIKARTVELIVLFFLVVLEIGCLVEGCQLLVRRVLFSLYLFPSELDNAVVICQLDACLVLLCPMGSELTDNVKFCG